MPSVTPTSPLTPELISSLWRAGDVRLSPDGTRVAWEATPTGAEGEHGEGAIWVARVGDPASARRWTRGGKDTRPRWSPDGTRLAFCSDRAERGTMGLYVLDLAGGEAEPVLVRERSVTSYAWSPDGSALAVLAPDEPDDEDKRRVDERHDADVFGERWRRQRLLRVEPGAAATVVWAPELHLTDVAWSPDGERFAVVARATPEIDGVTRGALWVLAADGSGAPRQVAPASLTEQVAWSDDGEHLLYLSTQDANPVSSMTCWSVPADGGEPAVVGPGRDESRCAVDLCVPAQSERVVLVVAEGLDTRFEWCHPGTGDRETLAPSDGDVESVDVVVTGSGPVLAAVVAAGAGPFEVWAGPPGRMQPCSTHNAPLAEVRLGAVEDFAFTGSDGTALDAVLIRPPDGDAGPLPTVVLVHGGPYWRSGREAHCHALDWGQLLATAGYAVLMPNYRGGMGHGNAFAAVARSGMGTVDWDDVMAATDAAVERGIADPARLGIGGWSQGGFLTAWAVTQTDRFAAAVMGAGVSDWAMMAATSDLPSFEAALAGEVPWDGADRHRAARSSPLSYAARRTTPLLILHGQDDERVPFSQAVAFHRAVRDQDAPVTLVSYPREPHAIGQRRHQVDVMRRVREWFDRWL